VFCVAVAETDLFHRAGKIDRIGEKPRVLGQLASYSEATAECAKSKYQMKSKATNERVSKSASKSHKNAAKLTILDFLT